MRILLVADDCEPESTRAAGPMMHSLGSELVRLGHEVSTLAPTTNQESRLSFTQRDGITMIRFRCPTIKNTPLAKRLFNESSLSVRAYRATQSLHKLPHHDRIVFYSPTIFWGPLILLLKKRWNAKSLLLLRDIFPQWTVDAGIISNRSLACKYLRYFEKLTYRAADKIAVQSPGNLEYLNSDITTRQKALVIYNWSPRTKQPAQKKHRSLDPSGSVTFVYGGNIGRAQSIHHLLALAEAMKDMSTARFLFVGAGDAVPSVTNAIAAGLGNIAYLPTVPLNEYMDLLATCDIGLFCLSRKHTTHNVPGKLLQYMSAGLPLLGCTNPNNDLIEMVNSAEAGCVSVTGDHATLVSNAVRLLRSPDARRRMGTQAKRLLDDSFSVGSAADAVLKSLL